jgi:hypothetical protein
LHFYNYSRKLTKEETGEHIKKGKLNLVDLSGSEHTSKIKDVNGAEGF